MTKPREVEFILSLAGFTEFDFQLDEDYLADVEHWEVASMDEPIDTGMAAKQMENVPSS